MLSNNGDVDMDNMSEGGGDDEEATEESSTLEKMAGKKLQVCTNSYVCSCLNI